MFWLITMSVIFSVYPGWWYSLMQILNKYISHLSRPVDTDKHKLTSQIRFNTNNLNNFILYTYIIISYIIYPLRMNVHIATSPAGWYLTTSNLGVDVLYFSWGSVAFISDFQTHRLTSYWQSYSVDRILNRWK